MEPSLTDNGLERLVKENLHNVVVRLQEVQKKLKGFTAIACDNRNKMKIYIQNPTDQLLNLQPCIIIIKEHIIGKKDNDKYNWLEDYHDEPIDSLKIGVTQYEIYNSNNLLPSEQNPQASRQDLGQNKYEQEKRKTQQMINQCQHISTLSIENASTAKIMAKIMRITEKQFTSKNGKIVKCYIYLFRDVKHSHIQGIYFPQNQVLDYLLQYFGIGSVVLLTRLILKNNNLTKSNKRSCSSPYLLILNECSFNFMFAEQFEEQYRKFFPENQLLAEVADSCLIGSYYHVTAVLMSYEIINQTKRSSPTQSVVLNLYDPENNFKMQAFIQQKINSRQFHQLSLYTGRCIQLVAFRLQRRQEKLVLEATDGWCINPQPQTLLAQTKPKTFFQKYFSSPEMEKDLFIEDCHKHLKKNSLKTGNQHKAPISFSKEMCTKNAIIMEACEQTGELAFACLDKQLAEDTFQWTCSLTGNFYAVGLLDIKLKQSSFSFNFQSSGYEKGMYLIDHLGKAYSHGFKFQNVQTDLVLSNQQTVTCIYEKYILTFIGNTTKTVHRMSLKEQMEEYYMPILVIRQGNARIINTIAHSNE